MPGIKYLVTCLLLLGLNVDAATGASDSLYWVTEIGKAPNPYTVIRIYSCKDEVLKEIWVKDYQIDISRKRTRRKLQKLLENHLVDEQGVADRLKIHVSRIQFTANF
ncbi:hypothetical protein DVR12_03945 [Chitinophaga silvatica]|uniref:Uncharacterized protein n=1 Tax=Chitinophaga silvatica TaxID=2282649 RepID=A0A3E1YHW3_9BACT|nr:hypothetical protein [Chitinophaga silvatica]RFS26947.1 hypothetical protein DVR12_03945 [Chitinophaga silvatica]